MSSAGERGNRGCDLVPVSALNQYLYCPRRYWYYRFYDPDDRSAALVDGHTTHSRQSRRAGWYREQYYRSKRLGLCGQVDLVGRRLHGGETILGRSARTGHDDR